MPRYPDVQTTRRPDPQISRRPDAQTLRFSHVKTPKYQIPKNWQIFWLEFCPTQNRSWTESVQLSWSWTVNLGQKHWKIRLDGKPVGQTLHTPRSAIIMWNFGIFFVQHKTVSNWKHKQFYKCWKRKQESRQSGESLQLNTTSSPLGQATTCTISINCYKISIRNSDLVRLT